MSRRIVQGLFLTGIFVLAVAYCSAAKGEEFQTIWERAWLPLAWPKLPTGTPSH